MSEPDFLSRAHYDEDDGETDTGFVFLFKWIEDTWGETARDIANQVRPAAVGTGRPGLVAAAP